MKKRGKNKSVVFIILFSIILDIVPLILLAYIHYTQVKQYIANIGYIIHIVYLLRTIYTIHFRLSQKVCIAQL